MPVPAPPKLRIGLPDIARLARVQRPVVSMWRTRSAATDHPFPEPIARDRGQEWFDAARIADWLEATGRGNNPEARRDLAAFASPDTRVNGAAGVGDEASFLGVTALLCLAVLAGHPFGDRTADDLLDLADEYDPDDDLLYDELAGLGERLAPLARYADLLADAAYNHAAAFEKLMTERFRLHLPGHASIALSGPAVGLVSGTALALADQEGIDAPTFVDPTPGGSDLLVTLAARAEGRVLEMCAAPGDDPASRLARRRLRVHGVPTVTMRPDDDGGYLIPDGSILTAQYPGPGAPELSDLEILRAIGDLALQTTSTNRAVIIAPASALTDRLASRAERAARDELLRTDRLRALVRLPRGLRISRPRQHLALCCLGPAPAGEAPADRRMMIGDLTNTTLAADVIADLVTDIVAAMTERGGTRQHRPRFLRPALVRLLRTSTGDLSAVGPTERPDEPAALALRIADAAVAANAPLPEWTPPVVVPSGEPGNVSAAGTLGAAVARRAVLVLPGQRIRPDDVTHGPARSGLRVIGPRELTGASPVGARTIDRLTFTRRLPSGHETEPGDVIFCGGPRPAALVDDEGGSVAAYPARIARIDPERGSGILARVLAADINALPDGATAWRAWPIHTVTPDRAESLAQALAGFDRQRESLRERLSRLDEIEKLTTAGVAAGTLTITATKGH